MHRSTSGRAASAIANAGPFRARAAAVLRARASGLSDRWRREHPERIKVVDAALPLPQVQRADRNARGSARPPIRSGDAMTSALDTLSRRLLPVARARARATRNRATRRQSRPRLVDLGPGRRRQDQSRARARAPASRRRQPSAGVLDAARGARRDARCAMNRRIAIRICTGCIPRKRRRRSPSIRFGTSSRFSR